MSADTHNHRISHLTRVLINGGLLAGCLAFGSAAQAGIDFTFDYGANDGLGFWDPTYGAARQDAMAQSATAFSTMFGSYFSNSATILLQATATDLPSSSNLASAGSLAFSGNGAGFTVNEVVRTKALTGVDGNGAAADGFVNVNFGQPWNLSAGATSNVDFDFYSTIFHEYTHALGFASGINQDGSPFFGGSTAAGEWTTYDQYLVDVNGTKVVNTDFSLNQAVWDVASVGGASPAGGLFFNGTFAMAANGGNPVGLYTPTTWEEGSSVSHTDDDNPAIYGTMMTAKGPTGPWPRDYSAIEVGMMRDLGYTAVPVPEPETYAMMLAGLGLVGWAARRSKA
ncbi:MAG: PEP-CTERM sorting domain-containing protein [Thiobacillus sp.]